MAIKIAGTEVINDNKELVLAKLAEIDSSISVTAVDVFVYDTSKDSDGGAWRKRTQGTSWYNETLNTATRGSRREFPAVAVIVVDAVGDNVTIYDGDDPALPMWMVFEASWSLSAGKMLVLASNANAPMSSGYMLDGKLAVGSTNTVNNVCGLHLIDFIEDRAELRGSSYNSYTLHNGIAERNATLGIGSYTELPALVSGKINDVAMTVLPNAPIDAATGLPVPTIAVATDGGVSVIKDDGTVVDITGDAGSETVRDLNIDQLNRIWITAGYSGNGTFAAQAYFSIPDADTTYFDLDNNSSSTNIFSGSSPVNLSGQARSNSGQITSGLSIAQNNYAFGFNHRLSLLGSAANSQTGMVAYTTSTYNTGWMNGDIKGAFLSDTDDTDLVGSAELVTNGTFDTDTSGWTANNTTLSVVSGKLKVENSTANYGNTTAPISLEVGKQYVLSFDFTKTTYNAVVAFNTASSGSSGSRKASITVSSSGSYSITWTADTASMYVAATVNSAASGAFFEIDNVSVKLADADRSVNNNGLIVNGTVTRSPVATGADLVAYSGFSASNYLEQPYNSDLDFGTGDFCVMGWVKTNSSAACVLFNKAPSGSNASPYFEVQLFGGNYTWVGAAGANAKNFGAIVVGAWQFLTYVRKSGVGYAYLNASLNESEADTNNYNHSNTDVLRVGLRTDDYGPYDGSLALLRISATAPTAEQIAKIYEDEKVLFTEGSQATLYGSSDAVTALAYDDATNLLHVGTSAGRSVFQGLRRVDNTTTAVGTAISASNGLIAEE